MQKKILILVAFAGGFLVISLVFLVFFWEHIENKFLPDNPWPSLNSPTPIDPIELQALENVVGHSKEIWSKAYSFYDISDFPLVFVDDPSIPLSREQIKYLNGVRTRQTGLVNILVGQGWLSYSRSLILDMASGYQAYQLQLTLAAQGKTMSPDDYRKVGAPVPPADATPTNLPLISNQTPSANYQWKVSFSTIKIEANQAQVGYPYIDRWENDFLVKTAAGWRIAGARFP